MTDCTGNPLWHCGGVQRVQVLGPPPSAAAVGHDVIPACRPWCVTADAKTTQVWTIPSYDPSLLFNKFNYVLVQYFNLYYCIGINGPYLITLINKSLYFLCSSSKQRNWMASFFEDILCASMTLTDIQDHTQYSINSNLSTFVFV